MHAAHAGTFHGTAVAKVMFKSPDARQGHVERLRRLVSSVAEVRGTVDARLGMQGRGVLMEVAASGRKVLAHPLGGLDGLRGRERGVVGGAALVHVGVLVEVRLVRHPEGVRRAQEALVGPGFYDNRGFEFNVANAVNIRAMIKSSKTVRILGMLNYFGLLTDRGGSVDNLMATFTKMLGSVPNLIEHCKSVLVLISKMPQNILLVKFRNRISTNHPTFPPELLDQLCLSDPLQRPHEGSLTREELLAKVMTLDAIHTDSTEMFNTVLNAEDQTSLLVGKNTRSVHGAWGCLGGVSTVYRPCTDRVPNI